MRVPLRAVPIAVHPGEYVFVVAEHEDKILYYSDNEEGRELESADASGGFEDREANQFEITHLMWQLFGDPELT